MQDRKWLFKQKHGIPLVAGRAVDSVHSPLSPPHLLPSSLRAVAGGATVIPPATAKGIYLIKRGDIVYNVYSII